MTPPDQVTYRLQVRWPNVPEGMAWQTDPDGWITQHGDVDLPTFEKAVQEVANYRALGLTYDFRILKLTTTFTVVSLHAVGGGSS